MDVTEICAFGDFLGSISKSPSHLRILARHNIPTDKVDPRSGVIIPSTYCQKVIAIKELVGPNTLKYAIIDRDGLVRRLSQQSELDVVLKPITRGKAAKIEKECPAVKTIGGAGQHGYCEIVPGVDPKIAFADMRDRGLVWDDVLTFWMTENCGCDMRIVDMFKNLLVPLYPLENDYVETIQGVNPHCILFTNSGVGKTYMSETTGIPCGVNETEAGLFGGPVQRGNSTFNTVGSLEGVGGGLMFDEVIEEKEAVFLRVLNYAEQGKTRRILKEPISCKGTKTLVFSSNLKSTEECEIASHFKRALEKFATDNAPERVGRRIGVALVGNDFKTVDQSSKIVGYRAPFKQLLTSTLIVKEQLVRDVEQLVLRKRKWQEVKPEEYYNELSELGDLCDRRTEEGQIISDFIKGMMLGYAKTKVAVLRLQMLRNLDALVLDKSKMSLFTNQSLDDFFAECSIPKSNIESLQRLVDTVGSGKLTFTDFRREFFKDLSEDTVKLTRDYADKYHKSDRHIRRWKSRVKDIITP